MSRSESFKQAFSRLPGLLERIEPVFIEQRSDLGIDNLAEPFPGITDRNTERRRDIAVSHSELRSETGISRDVVVQCIETLLDLDEDF